MKNQNKKLAKVLAATIFGVGFVTPLMFDNIAEAANFGVGETKIITTDAEIKAGNGTKWANSHNYGTTEVNASNSVVLVDKNGDTHLFKIVAADTSGGTGTDAVLTLWSYDNTFGKTKFNNSGDGNAYSESVLEKAADGLATGILSNLTLIPYTSTATDPKIEEKEVWIPSQTEVQDGGSWGLTGDNQRAIWLDSWVRSPKGVGDGAYFVTYSGYFNDSFVDSGRLLRPALQINNQTSFVFSSKAAIPTNGNFTVDAETGDVTEYQMAIADALTVSGITLDGNKIMVTTSTLPAGWKLTGLLTAETDSTKNDTWAHLNGTTANIAYMAQADSSGYFHPTNEQVEGKALKLFGMKSAAVTELSDKAITGLSIVGSKLHMQVKDNSNDSSNDGVNSGIPLILKNGAVVDLAGDASNTITLAAAGTGKLNLGANTYSGVINNKGTLTVEGSGSLKPGTGSYNSETLELLGGTLGSKIGNAGTVKLGSDAALAGKYVVDGTLEFTKSMATNVGYLSDGTNLVDDGATLTLLDEGTVSGIISGAGYVTVGNGTAAKTVTATVDQLANTGKITVAANATLELTSGTLTKTINNNANGTVKLNGATLGGKHVTAGTLEFAATTTITNLSYLAADTHKIDDGVTLTLQGDGTLGKTLSGTGEVVINGNVSTKAADLASTLDKITVNGNKTLTLTEGTLGVSIEGAGHLVIGDGTSKQVTATADQLGNTGNLTVTGNDTLELTGGSLGKAVKGTGSLFINGTVTMAAGHLSSSLAQVAINTNKTLTLLAGTLGSNISGSGNITIGDGTNSGTVTATLTQLGNTGSLSVATNNTLNLTAGNLTKEITNSGTVKFSGTATLDGKYITAGTLEFAKDMILADASYVAANTNIIDATKTLTLTKGTLSKTITGDGNVTIGDGTNEGTVKATVTQLGNTGNLTVADKGTLELTDGDLTKAIDNSGTVKLNGATLGGAKVTTGTLEFAANTTVADASYVAAATNKVDEDVVLTLNAGELTKEIANSGTVAFNGASMVAKITGGTVQFKESGSIADLGYIACDAVSVDSGKTLTLLGSGALGKTLSGEGTIKIDNSDGITASAGCFTQTGGLIVAENSKLTLTEGNILGNITNSGKLKINTTGTVIATGDISGTGTVQIASGTLCYSGTTKLGNKLQINEGATLDPDAGVLADDTTNNGNLYLSDGTLATNIKGSGTTYLKKNATTNTGATVTVLTDRTISGSVDATDVTNNSTIKMTSNDSSSAINTLNINNALIGTIDLQIDVDMSSFTADKLVVTNIDGATVNLTNINVTRDIMLSTMELPKSEQNKITYVTSTAGTATYNIKGTADGSIISLTNGYKYTFTKGTEEGKLNYTVEGSTATFKQFVEGTLGASTFNLTSNLENSGTDIETIIQGGKTPLCLNLNGLNLTSATSSTVTIGAEKTFNVNGGNATNAGTTNANTKFNVSGGTLNVSGKTTMGGDLTNSGTVNMDGTTTINGTITNTAGTMTISGTNKLNGTVTNSGTMTVAGETTIDSNVTNNAGAYFIASSGNLTFKGTINNSGNMQVDGVTDFKGSVTNNSTGVLTTGGETTMSAAVINDGTMNIGGTTTISGTITNNNAFNNNGTTTLNAQLSGEGTYTNSGTLNVADAANLAMTSIANTGTIELGQATVSVLGATINGGNISIVGNVNTTADKLAGSATVAADKNLTITGGNISGTIGGDGKLIISTAAVTNTNKKGLNAATLQISSSLDTEVDALNIASGITNNGTLTISGDGTSTDTLKNDITGDTGSMNISGTITVESDKTITQQNLTVNSGAKLTANTDNLNITNNITNSGELEMNKGTNTDTLTQVINSGNVTLNNGVKFDNTKLSSVGTLTVDNAIYNFNATLNGANITVDQISVTGKASGTLQLGTINITGTSTSAQWSTGETKTVQYLSNIDQTSDITVANNSYVTSGMFGYNFSQAKTGDTPDYGKLTVLKTFAYTLHQAVVAENEAAGSIETYYLTGDYTETEDLGVLKAYGTDEGRTFTINCSGNNFAGDGHKGIILNNSKDELNLANIKKISGWADSGVVENNSGTVNITNTTTTTLNSKLVGAGTYNLSGGTLKVEDLRNLAMSSITNKGTMEIGNDNNVAEDDQLTAVIKGGIVKLQGNIFTSGEKLVDGNGNDMNLNLNDHTLNISNGDLAVQVGSDTNKAGTLHIAGTANTTATKAIYTAVNNEGNLTTEANNLMNTVENHGTLELTAGTLNKGITNSGIVKLNGAALGGAHVTAGTLEFAKDITVADASYITTATNTIDTDVNLTLKTGTLGGNLGGTGNVVVGDTTEQTVKATVAQLGNTGKLTVANNGTLELTEGTLAKAVTNNGTVKLNGATLGGAHVTAGTLEFAQNLETNADYVAATTNKVDSGVTLTLTDGNLSKAITNDATGTVKLNGATLGGAHVTAGTLEFAQNLATNADYIAATTNKVDSGVTLTLTAGNLSKAITNDGTVKLNGATLGGAHVTTGTLEFAQNLETNANYIAASTNKVDSGVTLTLTAGTLNKGISNSGTVKLNGATLGGAHVTAGTLEFAKNITVADASYIAASTNKVDSGVTLTLTDGTLGGTLSGSGNLIIGNGTDAGTVVATVDQLGNGGTLAVAANGTLTLTAGTLDKTITNNGTVNVDAVTGTVTVAQNINGGILNVVSGLMAYTGSEVIGSTTVVKSGAKLDPSASLLNISTTVEEGGSLYLSGGTLGVDINGKGTTYLKGTPDASSGATVTVDTTRNVAGTVNLSGGTLDMQGSNTVNTLNVGTLSGNGNIKFDATINGASTPMVAVDTINATTAGGTVTLGSVNLTNGSTSTTDQWAVGAVVDNIDFIKATTYNSLTISGTVTATSDGYKYEFTQGTNTGKLKVTKGYSGTLADIVQNRTVGGQAMGKIPTYSILDNYTTGENLGTFKGVATDEAARTLTIYGNSHSFGGGNSYSGIGVRNVDTLTLTDISEISGWNTYVVDNAGTVNIDASGVSSTGTTVLNSKLQGEGTYNLTGGTLKVEDLRNLAMTSITNKGTMEIGGNSTETTVDDQLTAVIKGGIVKLQGDIFTTGEKLVDDNSNNMNLNLNGHTLNISDGDLAVQVGSDANKAGTLHIAGTANTTAAKAIYTAVNNEGHLTTEADNLMNTVENHGTLELTAGTLNKAISNDANGTIILNGAALGGAYVTAGTLEFAKDITVADASYITTATNTIDTDVNLTLKTGTLGGNLGGTGNVVVGDGTVQTVKTTVAQLGNTGKLTVANNGTLELTEGTLAKAVNNNGIVKLNGATMDSERVKDGTIEFAKNLTINGEYISNAKKVIDENVNLTVNGGTITNNITGEGTLTVATGTELVYEQTNDSKIDVKTVIEKGARMAHVADVFAKEVENHGTLVLEGGNLNAPITNYANTSTMEVRAHINMAEGGKVVQQAGSNLIVPVDVIESVENNSSRALFQGITNKEQLDVGAGNLTVTGQVKDGYYYVLASGTAIDGVTLTENDLWKLENIDFKDILMADYEIKYNTNTAGSDGSIALHVNIATTIEEGNTSGLAAVQQGNISITKEFTGEVENHLSLVHRPTIKQQNEAKLRNVLNEKTKIDTDNLAPEVIETGKVEEIMPVQVKEKEIYDKEIWASYVNSKETTEGMKLGAELKGDNTAKYDGTVVGLDFHSGKHSITGMAVSYSKGDINSYSNATATRNKAKYYGVSFYDRIASGNTAVIYDIGYVKGNNEINQFYGGKDFAAEVDSDTYTAGIRLEAALGSTKNRVVPFAAFRYMRQNNKDYTNSHKTQFDVQNQNLYIPKAGIAWTGEFTAPNSVCTWRPSIEAGYIWNLGDRTANSTVYAGTRVTPINYDVVDKSSFYGKLGLEFMAKNFTAGVFYRYLKGNAVKNNKWNVNVSWAF